MGSSIKAWEINDSRGFVGFSQNLSFPSHLTQRSQFHSSKLIGKSLPNGHQDCPKPLQLIQGDLGAHILLQAFDTQMSPPKALSDTL